MKWNSKSVRIYGILGMAFGVFNFIIEHLIRYARSGSLAPTSTSIGIESGIVALIIASLFTIVVARALKSIEDRLDKIERSKS